jgi:hypothetical protein
MKRSYYLPTESALAIALFTPSFPVTGRKQRDDIISVEYLNYGIIGGVQITSLARSSIIIKSALINNEFTPSLHAPREEGRGSYLRKRFPRRLRGFGSSFFVITDAPASDHLRGLCYGKPIDEVKVCTNRGDFAFKIDEIVWCWEEPLKA